MRYLVVGAGGTGGSIGGYLARGKRDVTFIARGAHLKAIQEKGLTLKNTKFGDFTVTNCQAYTAEQCPGQYDIIFVCVKAYSIPEMIPLLRQAARRDSLIIPILNVFGIGGKLAKEMPGYSVLDGCIYISGFITEPGVIGRTGDVFRVVYGMLAGQNIDPYALMAVKEELEACGIDTEISEHIARDTFRKHAFLSPYAAASVYYDMEAQQMQKEGEEQKLFIALIKELTALGRAMGVPIETDLVSEGVERILSSNPAMTASLQKDMKAGKPDERDVLLFEPVRLGRKFGVAMPNYEKVAAKFGWKEKEL